MTDQGNFEIDQLWVRYSKVDLWNRVSEWWESANQARVVMLLAMHHTEDLTLPEILDKTGAPESTVLQILGDLETQHVVKCRGSMPARYGIADEKTFLNHMQECCRRTSVAAGFLSTMAGWARGKD